jgi:NhaA family Na+:H+ antiporter
MSENHARSKGVLKSQAGGSYVARRMLLPAQDFIGRAGVSGKILLVCSALALAWANSPFRDWYHWLWDTPIVFSVGRLVISKNLHHLVNDGLMTIFFFAVALEVKRELLVGELSSVKRAILPVAAALGGMLVPAAIYVALNAGKASISGWGVPMATDIAFALAVLAALGSRIPAELRVLLLAVAVADDIGAVLVIAVFYTADINLTALGMAGIFSAAVVIMRRAGFQAGASYVVVGILVWLAMLKSGIHATLAGIVLGALTPLKPRISKESFLTTSDQLQGRYRAALDHEDEERTEMLLGQFEDLSRATESPLERAERMVHPWVTLVVLPLFALANAGVELSSEVLRSALSSPITLGIVIGLVAGKTAGIAGFSWLAVRLKMAVLPSRVAWPQLLGMAAVAGVGFTVSLFIAGLAFSDERTMAEAKVGILAGSIGAALLGYGVLRLVSKAPPPERRRAAR